MSQEKRSYEEINKASLKKFESAINILITKRFATPLLRIMLKTNLTPNQITVLGLIFNLVSAVLFAFGNYTLALIGCALFYLGFLMDAVDGRVAREKKLFSRIGSWLDEVCDRIRETANFIGVTIGLYVITQDPMVLIWGMLAGLNFLMFHFIGRVNAIEYKHEVTHLITFKKKYLDKAYVCIAYSNIFIYALIFMVIVKRVEWFLIIYATLGTIPWIWRIVEGYKLGKKEEDL